jgi:hypothetical protein
MGFVVDKVALGKVFPCQSSFHQLLHNHHHLSTGGRYNGPVEAAVPSGFSLTALIIIIIIIIIIKVISSGLQRKGFNFDEFKLGRLHEKHAVATWNLGTTSAVA